MSMLQVKIWAVTGKSVNLARDAALSLTSVVLGAGADTYVPFEDIFCGYKSTRVFASAPKMHQGQCTQKVLHVVRQLTPIPEAPTSGGGWATETGRLLRSICDGEFDLFTDGSWKETGDVVDKLLGHNMGEEASCGFCVVQTGAPAGKRILAVHIRKDISEAVGSAYPMELISIVAALRLSKEVPGLRKLWTDSESVLRLLAKPWRLTAWSKKANLVLLQAAVRLQSGQSLEHVRSHVERRKKDRGTWLPQEWGNWIADRVASGVESSLEGFNVAWVEITCSQILSDIGTGAFWHLTSLDGLPSLMSLEQKLSNVNKSDYLRLRDHGHADRLGLTTDPPALYWRDATICLAAKVWDMPSKSLSMAARAQRVIFDKLWFSWNIAKAAPLTEVICPLCGNADSLSHLVQSCPDPVCAGIRNEGLDEIAALAINLPPASKWLTNELIELASTGSLGHLVFDGMWNSDLRNTLRELITNSGYDVTDTLLRQWRTTLDDVSHSLVLITRALIANRIAGPSAMLPDATVGERIASERRLRIERVNSRRKKIKDVATKREANGGVKTEDDNLDLFLLPSFFEEEFNGVDSGARRHPAPDPIELRPSSEVNLK